jgi:hypothetical protein
MANTFTISATREWDTIVTNVCDCDTTDLCDGDCWETVKYFVQVALADLWEEGAIWHVDGLPLWDGNYDGTFRADTIDDFIRGVTVRGEWTLRLLRNKDIIHARLSHHDVPTGRSFTIKRANNNKGDNNE